MQQRKYVDRLGLIGYLAKCAIMVGDSFSFLVYNLNIIKINNPSKRDSISNFETQLAYALPKLDKTHTRHFREFTAALDSYKNKVLRFLF